MSSTRFRRLLALLPGLLLPLVYLSAEEKPKGKADIAAHKAMVAPFLAAHCTKCHGDKKQSGKLDLTALDADIVAGKDLDRWIEVAKRLKTGEMPPEKEQQPDPAAIKKVTDWIDGELLKAGKTDAIARVAGKAGNHVPHKLLFGPKAGAAFESPPRLWRLSPPIYAEFVKGLNKNVKVAQPFALPPGDGFKDVAGGFGIDESTTAQLIRNAETIVSDQLGLLGKASVKVKEFKAILEDAPSKADIEGAIRKQFELVLKRAPSADELKRFVVFHALAVKTGGPVVGARSTLTAVFLLPEANFRQELGQGPADGQGRRMLAPREIAFAIAYALTDRAPDQALLTAADKGKLTTKEDVAREVARLLDDAKTDKPRILRFFREYFGYTDAVLVFKENKEFPGHNSQALVDDTERLILDILREDKNVLVELLTTRKSYVAYKVADQNKKQIADALAKYEEDKKKDPKKQPPNLANKKLYQSYNLDDYVPAAQQPVELPAEQRAGILTQPSWLVAESESFQNHAIRRGKWVRERLLGGTVPDLPITVDAQLPEDPHKTLRQRMEITHKEYCWQCHQKMNPIGLTFENFDHFGRFRVQELDKPADASGKIEFTGDPAVDGDYGSSVEMIRKLAGTDRVRQVFVRHAFRYWQGRDETPGDARSLMAADEAFVKSGGSMKALITALLTSDSFLYRTNPTESK